jgi:hypothetical protein
MVFRIASFMFLEASTARSRRTQPIAVVVVGLTLSLSVISQTAFASITTSDESLNANGDARPCRETVAQRNRKDLVQLAAIIGADDRIPLREAKTVLSPQESAWLATVTGHVWCPGSVHKNGNFASAAIVGASGQILTAGHVFRDEQGRWREPLDKCYFETFDRPALRVRLAFSKASLENGRLVRRFGPSDLFRSGFASEEMPRFGVSSYLLRDYAVVGLDLSSLKQADRARAERIVPIPIGGLEADPRPFSAVLSVSAGHEDMMVGFDSSSPMRDAVVSPCRVQLMGGLLPEPGEARRILTDCDALPGSSGSVHVTRSPVSGALVATAVQTIAASSADNGKPYSHDIQTGALSLRGTIAQALAEVAGLRTTPLVIVNKDGKAQQMIPGG